jgi:outer membrane protein assembly factor BamD (BamD/ComL family)
MGQGKAAQARMQELIRKFPSSPEAARAKSFLKTNS